MNELVKVYGHRRSGNNLLCAMLKYNFYPDIPLDSKDDPIPTKFCTLPDGTKERYSPWGGLFGSHDCIPSGAHPRSIYIWRDTEETADSMIAFYKSLGWKIPEKKSLMRVIEHHHIDWMDNDENIYYLSYKQLTEDPEWCMQWLGKKFNLERVPDEWWIPDRKVGWNPRV